MIILIKNVLFDLDGTLLPMDLEEFMKIYFYLLEGFVKKHGYDSDIVIRALNKGTYAMVKNDGSYTNHDVFWKTFDTFDDSIDMHSFHEIIDDFYLNDFCEIERYVDRNQNMIDLVSMLAKRGFRLILATNPLFPSSAIQSRLRWTGVDYEAFSGMTTYEDFHYCKPNINYFQEVLERYELNSDECIMIGNDTIEDGVCEKLGIDLYLVEDHLINRNGDRINCHWHGPSNKLIDELTKKLPIIKKGTDE